MISKVEQVADQKIARRIDFDHDAALGDPTLQRVSYWLARGRALVGRCLMKFEISAIAWQEQVTYPAALVVGTLIRLRLTGAATARAT